MTCPQFHWQPDPPPVTEVEGGIPCNECGAADPTWTWVGGTYATGVSAPDGYQETETRAGWRCGSCKAVTEE